MGSAAIFCGAGVSFRNYGEFEDNGPPTLDLLKQKEHYCKPYPGWNLDIQDILRIAREANVDAIHPGYGFLSENPEFAEACAAWGIIFIGPTPDTMRSLGNKVAARNLATSAGVPVMPATPPLPADMEECKKCAGSGSAPARNASAIDDDIPL